MIDTAERRRSVIDFGKGQRGTGIPIPSGIIDSASRSHILNLYSGIAAVTEIFFFWRTATETSDTGFQNKEDPSSTWGSSTESDGDIFIKATEVRDS